MTPYTPKPAKANSCRKTPSTAHATELLKRLATTRSEAPKPKRGKRAVV